MNTKKMVLLSLVVLLSTALTVQAQTEIRTANEMAAIGKDKKSRRDSYVLMNDLTLENWKPFIFEGTFNGNGHTITLSFDRTDMDSKFKAASTSSDIGLFTIVSGKATIANLHITGSITCKSNHFTLAAGGIASLNRGKIVNCISSVNIKVEGVDQLNMMVVQVTVGGGHTGTPTLPYDQCTLAGGIAGINSGQISNCYTTGNIEVLGNEHKIGGGIAGGNGEPYYLNTSISKCYTTSVITVRDDGKSRIAGGIVGRNFGEVTSCVALNNKIDIFGKTSNDRFEKYFINANELLGENWYNRDPQNSFYLAGMNVNVENPDDNATTKQKKTYGVAVEKTSVQQQSWWENSPHFAFGQTNKSPWIWSEEKQCPILYWEKYDAIAPDFTN